MKKIITIFVLLHAAPVFCGSSTGGIGLRPITSQVESFTKGIQGSWSILPRDEGSNDGLVIESSIIDQANLPYFQNTKMSGPDLGLDRAEISTDSFRRARMRLSTMPTVNVDFGGKPIQVKNKFGAIVNMEEMLQFVPEQIP